MGCGGSSQHDGRRRSSLAAIFKRQKISIRIGNEVQILNSKPTLIFIFGGPGSKKGKISNDMAVTYGFKLLSAEKIILEELAKKIEATGSLDTTSEIAEHVKESPETITLDWALREIKKRIDVDQEGRYLVDVMPNLRFLVKCPGLVKDPVFEMKNFESSYPVSFAINFAVPLEKFVKKKQPVCVTPPKADGKEGGKEGKSEVKSDEADSGRTRKRATLFDSSIRPYVDYFQKSGRLVNVDVSSGMEDLIWGRICEVFSDLDVQSFTNVNTVILFSFDDKCFDDIELGRYSIQRIILEKYIEDPQEPAEKVLVTLCKLIDESDPSFKAFAVNLAGTSINKYMCPQIGKKSIMFIEEETSQLETHVDVQIKGNPCPMKFKVICSTEDEVCLFPDNTDSQLCKNIPLFMAQCRKNY